MPNAANVAIVMVTFNRADVTCLALDTLARVPTQIPFQVFLVDNKSRPEQVLRIQDCFEHLVQKGLLRGRLIISKKNLGFSGGNNLGILEAFKNPEFTHLCLLNNDTIVTPYWLDRLLSHNPQGLIGAVSNSVGNEQIVPVSYNTTQPNGYMRDRVWAYARNWYDDHQGQIVPTEMLGFFCVLGHRMVIEKIGLLDERFGIGTFEDDDYCSRARKLGLPLEIARDVFIHHWGSASFSRLGRRKLMRLMQKNRSLFEVKHQTLWKNPVSTPTLAYRAEIENHLTQQGGDPKRRKNNLERYEELLRGYIEWLYNPHDPLNKRKRLNAVFRALDLHPLLQNLLIRSFRLPRYLKLYWTKPSFRSHAGAKIRQALHLFARGLNKTLGLFEQIIFPGKNNLICLPICPYDGRRQRPQQLVESLKRNFDRIFWIEPQSVTYKGLLKTKTGIRKVFLRGKVQSFFTDQVPAPTSHLELDIHLLGSLVPRQGQLMVMVQSPYWLGHIEQLRRVAEHKKTKIQVVYDCMDHHSGFASALHQTELHEQRIVEACDVLLASSESLKSFLLGFKKRKPILLIKNGCSLENFPLVEKPPHSGTIGYFGAIAEWFEWDLVCQAAIALPEVRFELIGDFSTISEKVENKPSNIQLMGEIPFEELRTFAKNWDAGMIPFHITPLIEATNPVKLYEYSSLGLPILSTPIPEVLISDSDAMIVKSAQDFVDAYRTIQRTDSPEKRRIRRSFAEQNTWEARGKDLLHEPKRSTSSEILKIGPTQMKAEL